MTTTELITPPQRGRTFGEALAELVPLIGAIAGYGPPVILLAGPWLLLALMLSGAFAFLVILVAGMVVAATGLVALAAAPYLLARRLRSHVARHAVSTDQAAPLVPVGTTRVIA